MRALTGLAIARGSQLSKAPSRKLRAAAQRHGC
jgi:hypothetical protein